MPDFTAQFTDEARKIYDELRATRYDPGLDRLRSTLEDLIKSEFDATERLRVRVSAARVKQFNRLVKKAQRDEYRRTIRKPPDIFKRINDIVGIRITCNVEEDVYRVRDCVLRARKGRKSKKTPSLRIVDSPVKDYIAAPKASGYRALHLFVEIDVPSGGVLEPVLCEVQIRTLLQDAWGELTHEDTYKPEMKVPDIVASLSQRLATVLSVMDEIAQDIRRELDRVSKDELATEDATATSRQAPRRPLALPPPPPPPKVTPSASQLSNAYVVGEEYLGEVVYVSGDYALVQLPQGENGILHWSRMGQPLTAFVDVSHHLSVGDTIRVAPVAVNDAARRVELELVTE